MLSFRIHTGVVVQFPTEEPDDAINKAAEIANAVHAAAGQCGFTTYEVDQETEVFVTNDGMEGVPPFDPGGTIHMNSMPAAGARTPQSPVPPKGVDGPEAQQ